MTPAQILAILRQSPTLQNVPQPQLAWLVANGELMTVPAHEHLHVKGDPVDCTHFMLAGLMQIYFVQAGQKREYSLLEVHDLAGTLPFSRMKVAAGYVLALETSTLLCLHRRHYPAMIAQHYELTEALVHEMTSRVRENARVLQQNEKMMSLGKLSAGLAHELNNPAAAIVRSADALQKHLANTPERFKKVMHIQVSDDGVDMLNQLIFNKIKDGKNQPLSLLERNQREDELLNWLEDHQVTDAFDLAPMLVDYGFTPTELAQFAQQWLRPDDVDPVMNWVNNNLVTEKIVSEIGEAAKRIGQIVNSVKSYTHMDKGAGKEPVQLAEGIRNTLTLLAYKLKSKNIKVVFDPPANLPPVMALPGELNQVWTNLIDNAIDALQPGGQLEIQVAPEREFVTVSIIDNGPGIPPEIQDLVFDPFFTTKEVGKGTGLGLDIARNLVAQHQGRLTLESRPGRTEFMVCLPQA
ncbi:MAG: ATP-binding protein [Bernardetiaceae bacterium]|jgi:signal transduction histidine kinase|nr:ATP-binding protein [Bernardetiaceae bacterium]